MKKVVAIFGMWLFLLHFGNVANAQEEVKEDITDKAIEKKVDQIMEKYIGKEIPGASIGIVKDGKIILTKGYGVSDIESKKPVIGDKTVFELASITKVFTWSMLMKLAEEGKVKLDADIQEYLPEGTLDLAFDKKITILNLMNHTAGFEEKIEGIDIENVDQLKPLKETINKENQPKQVYEPGTVTAYSNYGANLGGYIIEQVTGQDYISYMNETVIKQLQMNTSTFSMVLDNQPEIMGNKSLGYLYNNSTFEKGDPNGGLTNDIPAGALQSTAQDMTHFMLAMLNNEGTAPYSFFKETATLKQFQTHSHGIVNGALGNAHGFWEEEVAGKRIIGHGGNSGSFSSQLMLIPEEQSGYVLLTNVANEATGIRDELKEALIGKETSTADLLLKKSPTDKKIAGRYRNARNLESTMGKIAYIIADFDTIVTENKDGGIKVTSPQSKKGLFYVEVEPGIYQKIQKGSTDKYLYFGLNERGEVQTMGTGMVTDSVPVSFLDTQLFNFTVFGISFITFLSVLIYVLFKLIRQKRKKNDGNWSRNYTVLGILSLTGLSAMINATAMIVKFIMNMTMSFDTMQPLFYLNWLLPLFSIATIVWLAVTWKRNKVKWLTVFVSMISVLTCLQFYNAHLFF